MTDATAKLHEDQELVCAHLHWDGERKGVLTADEQWGVFCQGDGFGDCSPEELARVNSGMDWSHVRDSTPPGWARMRTKLDGFLARKAAPSPA